MTDHIKVDASFIQAIVENAAWATSRFSITEGDKKGDKSKDKPEDKPDFTTDARKGDKSDDKPEDKPDFETGARKGDKSNDKKKKGDKPDFTTDQRKGDKSKTHAGKDFEGKESVEEHTCPLCESHLDEALTDEQISEHVGQIQDALLSLEEGGEPSDDDLDAIEAEPDAPSNDDDMDEKKKKKSKKEAVMTKVKELKKAASGK
jgi:hypothetical protein